MDRKSYYSVLEVPRSATQEQVQAAYKRLAFLHHPDRSSDPRATQLMQLLNEAYEVLNSIERRSQYDREQAASNFPTIRQGGSPTGDEAYTAEQAAARGRVVQESRPKTTPKEREEQGNARRARVSAQLKVLLGLSILLLGLFFLSILTGQVNLVAIFTIVIMAIAAIISMIRKIRNPVL